MDFVTSLPLTASGCDALFVFVDKLTKMVQLVPTTKEVDSEDTAPLFFKHVFALHGLP